MENEYFSARFCLSVFVRWRRSLGISHFVRHHIENEYFSRMFCLSVLVSG
jgi:hypothetical protein